MSKIRVDRERVLRRLKSVSSSSVVVQRTAKSLQGYYRAASEVVSLWLEALDQATSDQSRISLFYVANEILQSKSYGSHYFKQSWKPHLGRSIDLIKDSAVNDRIIRILNIWIERKVYEKAYVEDLIRRLSATKSNLMNDEYCKEIIMNFEPEEVMDKLKELINVEAETSEHIKQMESSIDFDDKICKETMKTLKDKTNYNEFTLQLDNNINLLFRICSMLEEELKVREKTIKLITNAEIYYQTQQSETFVVEDAYRRYGSLISKTKEALEEQVEFLMDDGGVVDLDDAPSPGKTPPHLYEENNNNNSPMLVDDAMSPFRSIALPEYESPGEKSLHLDKPYSPSHQIHTHISLDNESKPKLTSIEALKLLTSVFSKSLTKKPISDETTKVNLQSDIFKNTLAASSDTKSMGDDSNQNEKRDEKSENVFADAFRLISNLTGLKTINERTFNTEASTDSGSNIPILTSKIQFKNNEECRLDYNKVNFSASNEVDNIPRIIYPDVPNTSFPPPMIHMFNSTSAPPPPVTSLYNPLSFTMSSINQSSQQVPKSPGSCTDDEGGATPTQDESSSVNAPLSIGIFNSNMLPALAAGAAEINKHIQNVMNSASNPFSLHNMIPVQNNSIHNNHLQPSIWNGAMAGQYSFNTNMALPFSIMNQSSQIQPSFTPTQNSTATLGPPRAIRTKRPNVSDLEVSNQENINDIAQSTGSNSESLSVLPLTAQLEKDSNQSDNHVEDIESIHSTNHNNKSSDKDLDVINLYGDVEEEIDRNCNLYQQNINVRNSRQVPPDDRYHVYNNQNANSFSQGYYQSQNNPYLRPSRINYSQNNTNFSRNLGFSSGGYMHYFPNRTTNFRPKNNYNMFN